MVSIKLLKPYFIKINSEFIRIILAYQYFSIIINHKTYQFVPIEGQEIIINRKTSQVVNTETKFAFQKENHIIYLTLKKLSTLNDFSQQIEEIIKPYDVPIDEINKGVSSEVDKLIRALELENIKKLIDLAIDSGDQKLFHRLSKQYYLIKKSDT